MPIDSQPPRPSARESLAAALRGQPGIELEVVMGRAAQPPPGWAELASLRPDVILVDAAAPEARTALALLHEHPDLMVIALDVRAGTATALTSREQTVDTADDLTRLILADAAA